LGVVIASLEVLLVLAVVTMALELWFSFRRKCDNDNSKQRPYFEMEVMNPQEQQPQPTPRDGWSWCNCIGITVAVAGALYWFTIVMIYWNFVSYLMLCGLLLVGPGLIATVRKPKGTRRCQLLQRRLKLAGWFLGGITIALFSNLSLVPSQTVRHLNPSFYVLTPNDPSVLKLQQQFYDENPQAIFQSLPFDSQMMLVDDFIRQEIVWQESYPLYNMVGLLVTPSEVIGKMSGDCQGQAAVTASLLLSMGFKAWVVETPFHWWTHAEENQTGRVHNLNVHGHANLQGNVLPQPIDLVYTHLPPACTNCSDDMAYNRHGILYAADPLRAIGIAFTGAHILVRSNMTLQTVSFFTFCEMIFGLAGLLSVYSSYFQGDIGCSSSQAPRCRSFWKLFLARFVVSFFISLVAIFGLCGWASVHYPVALLHVIGMVSFAFTYVSSDTFNEKINS